MIVEVICSAYNWLPTIGVGNGSLLGNTNSKLDAQHAGELSIHTTQESAGILHKLVSRYVFFSGSSAYL